MIPEDIRRKYGRGGKFDSEDIIMDAIQYYQQQAQKQAQKDIEAALRASANRPLNPDERSLLAWASGVTIDDETKGNGND